MDIPEFRRSLLRWFARAKRPLPWRQTRDPYAIWISEAMLQQTTVAVVIPYYERFLKRLPNVRSLARADEDTVLSLWSGLGYYSRARNLRLAAQALVARHDSRFPTSVEEAMTLKGVGRYTASAVTSIAYGTRAAVVDGNVRRVLSRLHAARGLSDARALEEAAALLSPRSAGAWNEAMMELGATICTPRKPRCDRCPVRAHCRGRQDPERWVAIKPRRLPVRAMIDMALVERGGRILLVRNPAEGLMGGLYELPHSGLPGAAGPRPGLAAAYRGILRVGPEPVARIRHAVTHHRIEARIFKAVLVGQRPPGGATLLTPAQAASAPLGGLTRKALRALGFADS